MSTQFSQLDHGWLESGFLKRRSNYSPVILFESTDPKRLDQLKSFVTGGGGEEYEYVFVYDQWQGLARLSRANGRIQVDPHRKQASDTALSRRAGGEDGHRLGNLRAVLKEADIYLKKWKTFLLLQNLSEHREWETGLQSALRSWAIDTDVISRGSTVFLQTSDADDLLDEFTRELVVVVRVDPSSADERQHIIGSIARELDVGLEEERLHELVLATAGLNLHQLESILLESYFTSRRFPLSRIKELKSELVQKSGMLEIVDPEYSFGDIGGYQAIKSFVVKYIINVLRQSQRAKKFALPLPKGILFFGPPGTGKSLFANALATEIRLPFINLLTENIYSKWFGESGHRMRSAITMAEKMSPAIVFVDEIDRFGRRSQGMGDSAGEESKRVFSQFLEWLGRQDRQAIIVGTTNVPDHLDEAFLRTGRFDYKIPFLYPGESARAEIVKVHLGIKEGTRRNRAPLGFDPADIDEFLAEELVPLTRNFSGAELEELVIRSKRLAFDRGGDSLEPRDFLEAARTFRVNAQDRSRQLEEYLRQAEKFTDDQSFLDDLGEEIEARA